MMIHEALTKHFQSRNRSERNVLHNDSLRRFLVLAVSIAVVAFGLAGCGAQYNSGQAPPPPGSHTVTLHWMPSTSVVSGYAVHRGTSSGGPYTQIGITLPGTTQYTDTTVQNSQTYFYVVTAFDSSMTQSMNSNETSVTIPAS